MSDDFERKLREHLQHEARQVQDLPRPLMRRIRDAIDPRAPVRFGLGGQLATAGALVLVGILVGYGLQHPAQVANLQATLNRIVSPTPTPAPYRCGDQSGGTTGLASTLTALRTGRHNGYDRITFEFDAGIPSYDLVRQASPTFLQDPSGLPVNLAGAAGLKVTLRDTIPGAGVSDSSPGYSVLRQVKQIGDFERVLTLGIGLSRGACVRAIELSNPPRLALDFDTSGTSAPAASVTPAPTPTSTANVTPAASPASLPAFTCADQGGGSSETTAQLVAVRMAAQPGFDRLVFEFAGNSSANLPAFSISRQATAQFVRDPSGMPVTLSGSAGLRIVLHGVAAAGSYSGPTDLVKNLSQIKEVSQLGDYEAVNSWGVGLNQVGCLRVVELSNPYRLVIDVQTS